jgi:hypothetical protein
MEEFFIPKDFLGKKECKPGDTITLEVTQLDDDGDVGVKVKGYSHQSEEMEDDRELRAAFGEKEEA